MKLTILSTFVALVVPIAVYACEGECIVDITNEMNKRYQNPILDVMAAIGNDIVMEIVPEYNQKRNPLDYLKPLLTAYTSTSYEPMRTAIFPRFFHGKCQINGVQPEGCPNPDCPVVCGTPGSIVHFYPKFLAIAFNETTHGLTAMSSPKTDAYRDIEQRVMSDVYGEFKHARMARFARREEEEVKGKLRKILKRIKPYMRERCEGKGKDGLEGLEGCSWEGEMKEFILRYP